MLSVITVSAVKGTHIKTTFGIASDIYVHSPNRDTPALTLMIKKYCHSWKTTSLITLWHFIEWLVCLGLFAWLGAGLLRWATPTWFLPTNCICYWLAGKNFTVIQLQFIIITHLDHKCLEFCLLNTIPPW